MINQFFENINIKNSLTVKEGDTLNLGSHTLTFVMAPMVHWPEVMVTYESSEKVLFSADGFGKFVLCRLLRMLTGHVKQEDIILT